MSIFGHAVMLVPGMGGNDLATIRSLLFSQGRLGEI
jgi:hypothetical protein